MLGAHLVRRLSAAGQYEVVSLDVAPAEPVPGVVRVGGDIRDRGLVDDLMSTVDIVVHTAAALPSHRPEQIWSIDVTGTRTLLDAAARHDVTRFVHISSTAVYGLPRVRPTPEDHPLEAVDPYNRAKIEAERLCERLRDSGRCVPILRPKTFLGPERLGIFAMLFEWACEGRNFPVLGSGEVRCQMLDVEDLCDAVLAAMERPADEVDDVFNIAAAEYGTLREDFQAVLDAAGKGGRVVSIPARPAVAALRLLEVLRISPVYKRLAHKLLDDSYVCIDKARDRLGFRPAYSNTGTLLRTFEWYRTGAAGRKAGRTHRDPWRQGALRLAKSMF
jgi:nucleoside-diphosphate-sugar epimerase